MNAAIDGQSVMSLMTGDGVMKRSAGVTKRVAGVTIWITGVMKRAASVMDRAMDIMQCLSDNIKDEKTVSCTSFATESLRRQHLVQ